MRPRGIPAENSSCLAAADCHGSLIISFNEAAGNTRGKRPYSRAGPRQFFGTECFNEAAGNTRGKRSHVGDVRGVPEADDASMRPRGIPAENLGGRRRSSTSTRPGGFNEAAGNTRGKPRPRDCVYPHVCMGQPPASMRPRGIPAENATVVVESRTRTRARVRFNEAAGNTRGKLALRVA